LCPPYTVATAFPARPAQLHPFPYPSFLLHHTTVRFFMRMIRAACNPNICHACSHSHRTCDSFESPTSSADVVFLIPVLFRYAGLAMHLPCAAWCGARYYYIATEKVETVQCASISRRTVFQSVVSGYSRSIRYHAPIMRMLDKVAPCTEHLRSSSIANGPRPITTRRRL